MNLTRRTAVALTLASLAGCAKQEATAPATAKAKMTKEPFSKTADGTAVDLYTLTNKAGTEARITTYGGRIVSLKTADRTGKMADIVLGFDTLDGYLKENPFFGALVGRYGNRIGKGKFSLNGTEYKLATNDYMLDGGDGYNSLKGGKVAVNGANGKLIANDVMVLIKKLNTINPKVEGRIILQ